MIKELENIYKDSLLGKTGQLKLHIDGVDYTRFFRPKERLILLGAGHIARALCSLASMVDFQVIVVDDRAFFANRTHFPAAREVICNDFARGIEDLHVGPGDYIAIITRGHRFDSECIQAIYQEGTPSYIGLLGSKRRTKSLLEKMAEEGLDKEWLDQIHTPIGLAIGALTVEEIAVSIVAELIQCRRKDLRRKSKSQILVEETFHENVLKNLVESPKKKVLLLVYETTGSTPVKSGCFMTVDEDFQPCGTIGGGCAENEALKEAYKLVGSGKEKVIHVDLTNDVAGEEGMVCGGTMKIYLVDMPCR